MTHTALILVWTHVFGYHRDRHSHHVQTEELVRVHVIPAHCWVAVWSSELYFWLFSVWHPGILPVCSMMLGLIDAPDAILVKYFWYRNLVFSVRVHVSLPEYSCIHKCLQVYSE